MSKITHSIWSGLEVSASQECDIAKRKRGAPPKHGAQHLRMLYRAMLIIEGYQKYRMLGFNHRDTVKKAVHHVRSLLPNMRVSAREVDRVLAAYHSDKRVQSIVVERKLEEVLVDWEDAALGSRIDKCETREVLVFSFRARPKYPKRPNNRNF